MFLDFQKRFVGSVAERIKTSFLWQPCDHDRVIKVQLSLSSHTLLRPWFSRFTMICIVKIVTKRGDPGGG